MENNTNNQRTTQGRLPLPDPPFFFLALSIRESASPMSWIIGEIQFQRTSIRRRTFGTRERGKSEGLCVAVAVAAFFGCLFDVWLCVV